MYVGGFEMGIPFIAFGYASAKPRIPSSIRCASGAVLSLFFIAMVLGEPIVVTTYGIGTDCRRDLIQSIWRKFEVKKSFYHGHH